jgi:hypothetical protein
MIDLLQFDNNLCGRTPASSDSELNVIGCVTQIAQNENGLRCETIGVEEERWGAVRRLDGQ